MYYSKFFEEFKQRFSDRAYFYTDKYIYESKSRKQISLPLVMTTKKGIAFFVEVPEDVQDAAVYIRNVFDFFSRQLSLKNACYMACGITKVPGFIYSLDVYNNRLISFDSDDTNSFFELFEADLQIKSECFQGSEEKECFDRLLLLFKTNSKDKTLQTASGGVLVNRHGKWREASEVESDKLFLLAALLGVFGTHYFYERRFVKGILYLLTLGLFGFGWLFDVISLCTGSFKDKSGRYVIAPKLSLNSLIPIFIGAAITIGVIFLAVFIYESVISGVSVIATDIFSAVG